MEMYAAAPIVGFLALIVFAILAVLILRKLFSKK